MADCESPLEGEQHVLVACQHIVRALRGYKNVNSDLRKLLTELDTELSKMTVDSKSGEAGFAEVEERFKSAEDKVLLWQSRQSILWYSGLREAEQYLQAIYEIQTMLERFKGLSVNLNKKQTEFFNRAESIVEIAMSRLEKELCYLLDKNKQNIEPNYAAIRESVDYNDSILVPEDESLDEGLRGVTSNEEHEEHNLDLVCPNAVPHIKSIAAAMFACNYGQEFCEAFIRLRRDALDDYLTVLKMKKFSIEDVLNMDSKLLVSKTKDWIRVVKIIIGSYLPGEKRLCEQILGDLDSAWAFRFTEISKPSILSLLNFGEAVAMRSCELDRLFCLLNMCEVLRDLLPAVDSLLLEECGISFKTEFHQLSRKLGDAARKTLIKFEDAVGSHESSDPFPGGGVHPLTAYAMNYIWIIADYYEILNSLLDSPNFVEEAEYYGNPHPVEEAEYYVQDASFSPPSPTGGHLLLIISVLEASLLKKSRLYTDDALQHIFLLNNLHYMVRKVKGSKLRALLGDEWIRRQKAKFQQHATSYERVTWSSVLSVLIDDRLLLKDRCKKFTVNFEEVYRSQTRWSIPDPRLRDDVRISASIKVIQSYRSFIAKNESQIIEKHIKYTVDELENLLLDFFEGSPKSLRGSRRR